MQLKAKLLVQQPASRLSRTDLEGKVFLSYYWLLNSNALKTEADICGPQSHRPMPAYTFTSHILVVDTWMAVRICVSNLYFEKMPSTHPNLSQEVLDYFNKLLNWTDMFDTLVLRG